MCYIIRYYIFTPKPCCFCTACCIIGPQPPCIYDWIHPRPTRCFFRVVVITYRRPLLVISLLSRRRLVVVSLSSRHCLIVICRCIVVVLLSSVRCHHHHPCQLCPLSCPPPSLPLPLLTHHPCRCCRCLAALALFMAHHSHRLRHHPCPRLLFVARHCQAWSHRKGIPSN